MPAGIVMRDTDEKSGTHKVLPAGIVVQSSKTETIEICDDDIHIEIDLSDMEELRA